MTEPRSNDGEVTAVTFAPTVATVGCTPASNARPTVSPALEGNVGRYLVIEELGRGGMGIVLRAYDPRLHREVALKSVRTEVISAGAQERMLREAQAMAKLSHPNVVGVYDVELKDDAVILAMEFVPGTTLDVWLRSDPVPSLGSILDAFIAAGRGLAAAHAAGLLHRDFKPANVLVGRDGRVRVTDFGLARAHEVATEPSASREAVVQSPGVGDTRRTSELTEVGVVLGTPRYMAPEQYEGGDLEPATDQYAFCLTLWEALTGHRPFKADNYEALALAKLTGPPPWPRDSKVPSFIAEAVRRGLSVSPNERWPSMNALLEVLAFDPRARRRNVTLGIGLATAVAASGMAWAGVHGAASERCSGASSQIAEVWNEERRAGVREAILATGVTYARDALAYAEPALDAYVSSWMRTHVETCEATTIRGERSPELMDLGMACLQRAKLDLQAAVELLARADAQVVEKVHSLVGTLPPLQRCTDVEVLAAEVPPPIDAKRPAVDALRGELATSRALQKAGKYADSLARIEATLQRTQATGYGPLETSVLNTLANLQLQVGAYAESEQTLQRALRSAVLWKQWEEAVNAATDLVYVVGYLDSRTAEGEAYAQTAKALLALTRDDAEIEYRNAVSALRTAQGRYEDAEAESRQVLAMREEMLGPHHPALASAHANLGTDLLSQRRFAEAEVEYRAALAIRMEAFGAEHPNVAYSHSNLGNVLHQLGRLEEAESHIRAALAGWEGVLGPDHPDVAGARENLGNLLLDRGKLAEAEAEHRKALEIRRKAFGPDHPDVATSHQQLALNFERQERYSEAETETRKAIAMRERGLGADHPAVASSRNSLGILLRKVGRHEEAEAELRAALSLRDRLFGPNHLTVGLSRQALGHLFEESGRLAEAEAELQAALDIVSQALPADHPDVVSVRTGLERVQQKRLAGTHESAAGSRR